MRLRTTVFLAVLLLAPPALARDRGADGKFDKRESSHFVLYQDVDIDQTGGFRGSRRFEQQVLSVLENAYQSLDQLLGLRPDRKIDVVVYDPGIFDRQYNGLFRFQAAGFYHGVIRIRGATEISEKLQRVLHHELVHAALDAEAPSLTFPAWLNEGGAEWFEARALGKRSLSNREWQILRALAAGGELYSIPQLSAPNFVQFGGRQAAIAYLQSYALIDFLARSFSEQSLARFYGELIRTGDLARTLKRVYRLDVERLEQRFFAQLR